MVEEECSLEFPAGKPSRAIAGQTPAGIRPDLEEVAERIVKEGLGFGVSGRLQRSAT